jgi:hypothetical protein
MASCMKCGATLIALARFCATCGSPVARGSVAPAAPSPAPSVPPPAPSVAPAAPPPKSAAVSAPDPFAQTVLGGDAKTALEVMRGANVSPMAASWMADQKPSLAPAPAASQAPAPYAPRPASSPPAPQAPYTPPPPPSFAPGTLVLVYWADGQRYPGTVLQVAPHHVFVAFPNGVQQWIDARYVTLGA